MTSRFESLDTNVILRLMLGDLPEQRRAATNLLLSTGREFYISDLAISEAVHVMETPPYSHTRKQVADYFQILFMHPYIHYSRSLFEKVFTLYLSHPSLSFNDCYLSFEAEKRDHEPLWTFDRKLASQTKNSRLLRA